MRPLVTLVPFAAIALLVACGGPLPCDHPDAKCVEAAVVVPSAVEPSPTAPNADGSPGPGVKVHGNLPIRTESELAAKADARTLCLNACSEGDAACADSCMQAMPIEQVEVVPDAPLLIEPPGQ